eukprot:scaffold2516_cov153-Skeletonema_marinoi.AAC.3
MLMMRPIQHEQVMTTLQMGKYLSNRGRDESIIGRVWSTTERVRYLVTGLIGYSEKSLRCPMTQVSPCIMARRRSPETAQDFKLPVTTANVPH